MTWAACSLPPTTVDVAGGDRPARPGDDGAAAPDADAAVERSRAPGAAVAGRVGAAATRRRSSATARSSARSPGCPSSRSPSPIRRPRLTREEASYPGRRISLMIDASSSMLSSMPSSRLAQRRAQRRDVLHDGRRRPLLRRAADEGPVPRPDGARRVRRPGVRDHAVHDRLREHPVQHVAHRRLDRVHGVPRSGDDHRQRHRSERRACSRRSTFSMRPATRW